MTAVDLMRSRFSAYTLHNTEYLLNTWDAPMRPELIDFERKVDWQYLKIGKPKKGGVNDTKGVVEFEAYYLQDGEKYVMHEISRFAKRADSWFYLDGLVKFIGKVGLQAHLGKNSPCYCGSGKKFKRCCGAE